MRVIAGRAKGHPLRAPEGRRTRPTADRVKEALFSSLQPRLPGARVLDLYAGSGALAIEALSRGADAAVLVERNRRALEALRDNLAVCGLADGAGVVADDVTAVLRRGPEPLGGPFDLVVADPPYDIDDPELATVLELLPGVVAAGARITLETDRQRSEPDWPAPLTPGRPRRYGDTALHTAHHDARGIGRP